MEVKLIADVHGEVDALKDALKPGDTAVILGDLLNWVDFRSLDGMLASILSKDEIAHLLEEIGRGNVEGAKKRAGEFLKKVGPQSGKLRAMARKSYQRIFSAIPCRAYVIYGNVDYPDIMEGCLPPDVTLMEEGCIEMGGVKFGFVSGVPPFRWAVGLPGEVDEETYLRRIEGLGPVDVLCTHFPPAYEELTFDLVAQRSEEGSAALSEYIEDRQPEYSFFGHVHQPKEKRKQVGRTRLINTGYFRREKEVYLLQL
jgi:Icc-related predicted phosphoesterase